MLAIMHPVAQIVTAIMERFPEDTQAASHAAAMVVEFCKQTVKR